MSKYGKGRRESWKYAERENVRKMWKWKNAIKRVRFTSVCWKSISAVRKMEDIAREKEKHFFLNSVVQSYSPEMSKISLIRLATRYARSRTEEKYEIMSPRRFEYQTTHVIRRWYAFAFVPSSLSSSPTSFTFVFWHYSSCTKKT